MREVSKLLFMALISAQLFSCSIDNAPPATPIVVNEGKPRSIPIPIPTEPPVRYQTITVYEDEQVTATVDVAEVKKGDQVFIAVEEFYRQYSFSDYGANAVSEWEEEECDHPCRPVRLCHERNQRLKYCEWVTETGTCHLNFRRVSGSEIKRRELEGDAGTLRLRYRLGETEYSVGTFLGKFEEKLVFSFSVTAAMLRDSKNLELVIDRVSEAPVKIGYLGYGACQGVGERNFNIRHDRSSTTQNSRVFHLFNIDLSIKTILEDDE